MQHTLQSLECCEAIDFEPEVSDCQPVTENRVAGFHTGIVKDYVATLTSWSVQRRLRDKHRNHDFRKFVLGQSENYRNILICESDDLVLELPTDSPSENGGLFWYVKQEELHMLQEERDKLRALQTGQPIANISNSRHAQTQARALRRLHALHALVQFFLG